MIRPQDGILGRFTRDLTEDARERRLDAVRCRDDEIARLMDILLRQGKNNPALVGEAGVGKTAIVEGLAARMADGDVPLALRDMRLLAVDHVSLLAGTTYRGQYEERIRAIVEETTAAGDVVLFIDELHNLIGQGTALGAAMDAGNMLKPALVRGDFRVIGATTSLEYDRWIRSDPALERRFQRIEVRELGSDETLEILRARKDSLEMHHHVIIADSALRAAVELTDRHVSDRRRPDRALDALDEACAHTHATARYSERAEEIIRARRMSRRRKRSTGAPEEAQRMGSTGTTVEDDGWDSFRRESVEALERFGAGLEALFAGAETTDVPPAPPRAQPAAPAEPSAADATSGTSLAELERLLVEDGVVVRGVDVARVIARATQQEVRWQE
jgi:ATP-dependent Clp protease ATP-binding subunit ClpA